MTALEIFTLFYTIINFAGAIGIIIAVFSDPEPDWYHMLLFPVLVKSLREKLSVLGTTIVIILFSVFFAPAVIIYFIILGCFIVATLLIKGFMYIFKRKDI